jgi:ATP-binding cassette subfamily B protein
VIKNAEVLIFDDSTSALDLKTESSLRNELNKKFKDVSKIIIAQRIASVKDADKIIVLENGCISDMGTHSELLESSEIYKDIYNSQMKGDEA